MPKACLHESRIINGLAKHLAHPQTIIGLKNKYRFIIFHRLKQCRKNACACLKAQKVGPTCVVTLFSRLTPIAQRSGRKNSNPSRISPSSNGVTSRSPGLRGSTRTEFLPWRETMRNTNKNKSLILVDRSRAPCDITKTHRATGQQAIDTCCGQH